MLAISLEEQREQQKSELKVNGCSVYLSYSLESLDFQNFISQNLNSVSSFFLITDEIVGSLCFTKSTRQTLETSKRPVHVITIPAGESSKTRRVRDLVEDELFKLGCGRDSCLVAIGGGVVTDLVGFIASTFMRGIKFLSIPTSLLAMVDASVGGKTGIDHEFWGKNLLGSFYEPVAVFISLNSLESLPQRHWSNGMAEVIKTAILMPEAELFALLEEYQELLKKPPTPEICSIYHRIIYICVQKKAEVVLADAKEQGGLRTLLNLGHSIGHSIESLCMKDDLLHGEAVSIGLVKELELSHFLDHIPWSIVARVKMLLETYQLPVKIPENLCALDVLEGMKVDKKNRMGRKRIVLIQEKIGQILNNQAVDVDDSDISFVLHTSMLLDTKASFAQLPDSVINLQVPGSKSISNRVLLMAALSDKDCILKNLLLSEDTMIMIQALKKLKVASFTWLPSGDIVVKPNHQIDSLDENLIVWCGNAGTAARFLTAFCCCLGIYYSPQSSSQIILTGKERMKKRPIAPLVNSLREFFKQEDLIEYLEVDGYFPIRINPSIVRGKADASGIFYLQADVSSQFVSALLISSSLLSRFNNSSRPCELVIKLLGKQVPVSLPYIEMTLSIMNKFGVNAQFQSDLEISIETSGIKDFKWLKCPLSFVIESDASSATYPLALAAISGKSVRVLNMGLNSLQGDARFATEVLAPMGCLVEQDASGTLVTGPSDGVMLKALGLIDMETMTDAFLTLAVLACFAEGETRITGIQNQRCKECDRIHAMQTELNKIFGKNVVQEDGDDLVIHGRGSWEISSERVVVNCYDDHRVAMSISLIPFSPLTESLNIVIGDRFCVEKTWPTFWNCLNQKFGLALQNSALLPRNENTRDHYSKVILIGMRGSGKTTIAKETSSLTGELYIDLDEEFTAKFKCKIYDFIQAKGWKEFRLEESNILKSVLLSKERPSIVACGGGVVELEENRDLLLKFKGEVIFVYKSVKSNIDLTDENGRPRISDTLSELEIYMARFPRYWNLCNRVFDVEGPSSFLQFRKSIHCQEANSGGLERISAFACISSLESSDLSNLCQGIDCVELRLDLMLLEEKAEIGSDSFFDLIELWFSLKRLGKRIIMTARSTAQGGKWKFNPRKFKEFWLDDFASRLCQSGDIIDVELGYLNSLDILDSLERLHEDRGVSFIFSSHFAGERMELLKEFPDPFLWMRNQVSRLKSCSIARNMVQKYGTKVCIFKVVAWARSHFDCYKLKELYDSERNSSLLLLLYMGSEGRMSRMLAPYMTPVALSESSGTAAGQMTIQEIVHFKIQLGIQRTGKFYLFGYPIRTSPSPRLHNEYLRKIGAWPSLSYELFETDDLVEIKKKIREDNNFLGASVTVPLKERIMELVDDFDESSRCIGSVNTIVKINSTGKVRAFNTDWIGIFMTLIECPLFYSIGNGADVIIYGAGGTAKAVLYALSKMPKGTFGNIFIQNRSVERADKLILQWKSRIGAILCSSLPRDFKPRLVICTIPSDVDIQREIYLRNFCEGIFLDLSYKACAESGTLIPNDREIFIKEINEGNSSCCYLSGYQVLMKQANEQFRLFQLSQ